MKKLLGLTLAAILLVSCSDDDSSVNTENLVGKWFPTTTQIKGRPATPYENDCATAKDNIEFDTNGTGTNVYYNTNCEDYTDDMTYAIIDKTLTINFGSGNVVSYKVTSLSSSKLVIEEGYDADNDGHYDTTSKIIFTK